MEESIIGQSTQPSNETTSNPTRLPLAGLLFLLGLAIFFGMRYVQQYRINNTINDCLAQGGSIAESQPITCIIPSPPETSVPAITDDERTRGWYWGTKDQKKPGTPNDWIYEDAKRSSCWRAQSVSCTETTYTCPENGWENCMPILTPEAQKQCTKEAIEWKKKYCPGFQGSAL